MVKNSTGYLFIFLSVCVMCLFLPVFLCRGGTPAAKMEVKTSLLDNMIGVGDMVLLEPLSEDSFLENLRNRFDHNEIYVSLPLYVQMYNRTSFEPQCNSVALCETLVLVPAPKDQYRCLPSGNTQILFITLLFLRSLTRSSLGYRSGTDTGTTVTSQSINHITEECR